LINAGVKRVVVANEDPNPEASGGSDILAAHGIDVTIGPLSHVARRLNRGFFKRYEVGLPYTVAKMAISADGRTALASGQSKWISSIESREQVHLLRAQSGALVTGIGTVITDDPSLNVRLDNVENTPLLRVIIDPSAKLSSDAKLLGVPGKILQMVSASASPISHPNKEVVQMPTAGGGLDLHACWSYLADQDISDIFLECGPTLLGAALNANLVDELVLYVAPKLMGHGARPLAILPEIENMDDHHQLKWTSVRNVGPDIELVAQVINKGD
jgi:diaminohydroxyphosphoribosylaminopyrimidine deaminase/5-amino-6-(5-phosphoribosylamino)uracil reductase